MLVSINKTRLVFIFLISFIIWLIIRQYLFCPSFSFKDPQPFSGKLFYNPYDSINPDHWVKCNFHAHTNAWFGLTNGKGTAKNVYHVYDSMNYGVHCVSDYQSINKTYENTPGYIPVYEHGYNLQKAHQLVLGSHDVKWLDYIFPQTLNNKQDVLNCLVDSGNVVFVNHPLSYHGYKASDFKYLTNYQCIEALSRYALSVNCWDTALSNGRPVFIVGNDDEHDIFAEYCLGKMCTYINVSSTDQKTVLNALKTGEGYGVILGNYKKIIPVLNSLKLSGDTIRLKMSEPANRISFIGQNGKLLEAQENNSSALYVIKQEDHYIRTVIDYPSGTRIFLNPVFRYNKTNKILPSFHVNIFRTNLKRVTGLLFFIIWIIKAFPLVFSRRPRKRPVAESLIFQ